MPTSIASGVWPKPVNSRSANGVRDVVLEFAGQPTGTPAEQALLAEVIGLRTIVANLIFTFTSGSAVTADVMAGIVERADRTKVQRAIEVLRQLRIGPGQEPHAEKR